MYRNKYNLFFSERQPSTSGVANPAASGNYSNRPPARSNNRSVPATIKAQKPRNRMLRWDMRQRLETIHVSLSENLMIPYQKLYFLAAFNTILFVPRNFGK